METCLVANVRVERSDLAGTYFKRENHQQVAVELQHDRGVTYVVIALRPKELRLPFQPPLTLHGSKVEGGLLSIRFLSVRCTSWKTTGCQSVQVMLSKADPVALHALRRNLEAAMARRPPTAQPCTRQPLASLTNKHLGACRPALKHSSAPLTSCCTTSSTASHQTTATATSKLQAKMQEEELASLSAQQQHALDLVKAGKSIFFTGCAGTGKSLLLKHILRALPAATTFTTASTALAACQLGGTTINAFAGVGRAEGSLDAAVKLARRSDSAQRWRTARTVIVDEVSMLDGRLFDRLEAVARAVRGSCEPFGGLQLVLAGDFHQLPPVAKGPQGAAERRYCFQAATWGHCIHACLQLTQVYRQADDEFVEVLGSIRSGTCSAAMLQRLRLRCSRPLSFNDGILPTKLYTHREDVDAINREQLAALPGAPQRYTAQDSGPFPDLLASACPARREVELKEGAQVMLIRNISAARGLVNGARGVVLRFSGGMQLPLVRFANGETSVIGRERWAVASGGQFRAQRVQVPLELGWAISVHKCQGMTLDRAEVSLERAFEPGMAYVALSRVRSMEGLRVLGGIHPRALAADARVTAFYRSMQQS